MRASLTCALMVIAAAAVRSDAGADAPKPFPFNRTQIVKDGTFFIDGKCRIPKGIEITVQKDTKIVGKDGAPATIELEGRLTVQGVSTSMVVFEGVTVELQPQFEEVRLNTMEFRGASKGVVSKDDATAEGRIRIIETNFMTPATIKTVLTGSATIDLRGLHYYSILDVKAVVAPGATVNNVKLTMKECHAADKGWPSGLHVEGVPTTEIKASELGGYSATFIDCGSVMIDACYVFAEKLEFSQPVGGRYGKCNVQNCDLHCKTVALGAPEAPNPEKMRFENCWFHGDAVVSSIKKTYITDHDDDPKIGVFASVERPAPKPLQLTWTIQR